LKRLLVVMVMMVIITAPYLSFHKNSRHRRRSRENLMLPLSNPHHIQSVLAAQSLAWLGRLMSTIVA